MFAQDLVAQDPGAADMLVIAGYLVVDPDARDEYLARSKAVMTAASAAPGCLDFSMTADTLDPSRIRIFERWASKEQLLGFRGSGPSDEQSAAIRDAKVERYTIAAVGDPDRVPRLPGQHHGRRPETMSEARTRPTDRRPPAATDQRGLP